MSRLRVSLLTQYETAQRAVKLERYVDDTAAVAALPRDLQAISGSSFILHFRQLHAASPRVWPRPSRPTIFTSSLVNPLSGARPECWAGSSARTRRRGLKWGCSRNSIQSRTLSRSWCIFRSRFQKRNFIRSRRLTTHVGTPISSPQTFKMRCDTPLPNTIRSVYRASGRSSARAEQHCPSVRAGGA